MTVLFFLGGWIDGPDIVKCVDMRLLFLIATSISFAKSIKTSGLDVEIAGFLNSSNASPLGALFFVYTICLILTEVLSNNAAAALMYPIAVAYADELNVSYKPFAMIVLFSASAAFACPTGYLFFIVVLLITLSNTHTHTQLHTHTHLGYQTHMMVWQPGGYSFFDFVKFGLPIDIIYMVGACLLTPLIWKF